jgi:tRNA modification GTPase
MTCVPHMVLDLNDTIAAIGSAPGPAARGVVRVSGPRAIACLDKLFSPADAQFRWEDVRTPSMVTGTLHAELEIPCELFVWPSQRSYTRQPTVEIHMLGSAPLLDCALAEVCARGARLAEPGEFTLRAFLAGRIDLTQAEGVLGVIDARGQSDLDTALGQLAGGLSRPLAALREQLVQALAELEAGLDFADEDIEFISSDQLRRQLADAERSVAAIAAQMSGRGAANELPRVVLCGPPNVGKSSLFNALAARWGAQQPVSALVSAHPGTTRDYLTAKLDLDGLVCELVDTAGENAAAAGLTVAGAAQSMTAAQRRKADLLVHCTSATEFSEQNLPAHSELGIHTLTKADLWEAKLPRPALACSSRTGEGLPDLCAAIRSELDDPARGAGGAVASTALRCADSLRLAEESLKSALRLVEGRENEELIAAEVRHALGELGRVVGVVYTDDLLDRIFSQFCIGK